MDPDTYLSQFIALFNHIEVYPPDLGATIALVLSVLLLGCSGFVSASEIAFFSLSPTDVGKIEENRHAADGKILELKKDSERLLATILISNNFVNLAFIVWGDYAENLLIPTHLELLSYGGSFFCVD